MTSTTPDFDTTSNFTSFESDPPVKSKVVISSNDTGFDEKLSTCHSVEVPKILLKNDIDSLLAKV